MPYGRDLALSVERDERGPRLDIAVRGDLSTVEGDETALQSLLMRVLTARGELDRLGHPDYGSRLDRFLGSPLDSRNLRAVEALVAEALSADPRVVEVVGVHALASLSRPGSVDLLVDVLVDDGTRLRASLPVPED